MGLDTKLELRWWYLDATWAICECMNYCLSFLWSAEQYLQTQSYTEYTSGSLCRVIFYAALHFPIPVCIYSDTLFTSFTVWNTETCVKTKYSIVLSWIKCMQWLSWCWLIEMASRRCKLSVKSSCQVISFILSTLQTSPLDCCVALLQLSLHTKVHKNHSSTSGVITVYVQLCTISCLSHSAYSPVMFRVT